MVVVSVALCSKSGKYLLARQFIEISRIRIEGLLAAFPKLLSTGKEHTFVETDQVRYVYQPLEDLYLLLITNKSSNIVEDLETLRLMARVVPEFCPDLTDAGVTAQAMQLTFAFDEVLAFGNRENSSLSNIKTALEMDSNEEKVFKMNQLAQEKQAKELASKRAKEIDQERVARAKSNLMGFGSNSDKRDSYGSGSSDYSRANIEREEPVASFEASRPKAAPLKKAATLTLGSKKKDSMTMQALREEGELAPVASLPPAGGRVVASEGPRAADMDVNQGDVHVEILEKFCIEYSRDGGINSSELKGDMILTVNSESAAFVRVNLAPIRDKSLQLKNHPNINKQILTSDNSLCHKDSSKSFPVGTPLPILKWKSGASADHVVPIKVSCWPSSGANSSTMTIEYELVRDDVSVQNFCLVIPVSGKPKVSSCDFGTTQYDSGASTLAWIVDSISAENQTGSLEFSTPLTDADAFFPIEVHFSCPSSASGISIVGVVDSRSAEQLEFSQSQTVTCENVNVL